MTGARLVALALAVMGPAVMAGCDSNSSLGTTATSAPSASTTSAPGSSTTSTPGSSTTSVASTSTTRAPMPVAEIQIVSNGVVISLASRVSGLGNDVSESKLVSPTAFSARLTGVISSPVTAAPASASASSGLVSNCTLTSVGSNVDIAITLTRAVSSFQTAVGSGYIVQITFS